MARLEIIQFGGEVPRTSDTMLKENDATVARNVRLYSGELRTWAGPRLEESPALTAIETIFRFQNPDTNEDLWLTWDVDVDVQRSSLDDTTDFRLYYTGDGTPKKTNWAMAGDDTLGGVFPGAWLEMGVPAPTDDLTGTPTSGSSLAADSRYYVYTFVSTFGTITEESAPSPPSALVTITSSQSVDLTGFSSAPVGNYNITHMRIYRTLTGEESDGAYVFVKEVAIGTSTTNDDLDAADLGEALTTVGWDEPPDDLQGLTSMANGMMAGFSGNTVYFCEPYFHHAWPSAYMQSVPDQIVGLGSYGTTLVVMTKGQPYAFNGVSPDGISAEKISMPEPCISKKSIAGDQYGVLYASPNGIVAIGPNIRKVITNELFRRRDWQDYAPGTMVGSIYDGKYFASFESAMFGNETMIIARDDVPACSFVSVRARAFFNDVQEGELYYIDPEDDLIYQFDDDALRPLNYEWVSKRFVFPRAISFSALRLDISEADIDANALYNQLVAEITAANQAITGDIGGAFNDDESFNGFAFNGSILQELPAEAATVTAVVELYGDKDELRASLSIDSFSPRRIPPFKAREFKVKLAGNLNIRSIVLATAMAELHGTGT